MRFNPNNLWEILPILLLITGIFRWLTIRRESWKIWAPFASGSMLFVALLMLFIQGYRHNFSLNWVILIGGLTAVIMGVSWLTTKLAIKSWQKVVVLFILIITFLVLYDYFIAKPFLSYKIVRVSHNFSSE